VCLARRGFCCPPHAPALSAAPLAPPLTPPARIHPHPRRNGITTLAPFSSLLRLKELYLPNNAVHSSGLLALSHSSWAPSLTHLWLEGNPCAACDFYRDFCVAFLPSLEKLDTSTIRAEERARLCGEGARGRLRALAAAAAAAGAGAGAAAAAAAPAPAAPPPAAEGAAAAPSSAGSGAPAAPPAPRGACCAHQPPLLAAATLLVGQLDEGSLEALASRVAHALAAARGAGGR